MSQPQEDFRKELGKVSRIADMLCTAHNIERDRYRRRALLLDIALMLASLYLVSMAFVDPGIESFLVPLNFNAKFWTGAVAVIIFGLSIVQLLVNWKGRADAHDRSFRMYADAKSSCAEHLYGSGPISKEDYNRVRARYDMASEIGFHIPDNRFARLKQKHVQKVCISRDLDARPFMSISWSIVKFWWRDNFGEKLQPAKVQQQDNNLTSKE
ncbi:MAG: hypothetical protein H6954_05165 [Chromatiaceae bacterium]|nr:hypothetical protein [Chromatiaceae bacterium]